MSTRHRRSVWAWRIVLGIFVAAPGYFLLFPSIGHIPESSRLTANRDNLKQIMLAMLYYHEKHHSYPPAYLLDKSGKPAHSWRVLLLPFLDRQDLYDRYRFDERWDGPNNKALLNKTPEPYRWQWPDEIGGTHYQAIVGSQTMWPGHVATKVSEIFDGSSNTWSLLETAEGIPWTSPNDVHFVDIKRKDLRIPRSGWFSKPSFMVAFADGSVQEQIKELDWRWVNSCCTAMHGYPHPALGGSGLPFEAAESSFPAMEDRPLPHTDLWPTMRWRLQPARNFVYCSTMLIAMQERSRVLGQPMKSLLGTSPLATAFAAGGFPLKDLDPATFIAECGPAGPEFDGRIRQAIEQKFPGGNVPYSGPKGNMYAFCYLQKRLPFAAFFDKSPGPLRFVHAGGATEVQAFGCPASGAQTPRWQVRVRSYENPYDFVIALATDSPRRDLITVAKIPPKATLAETWSEATDRPKTRRTALEEGEPMQIPKLSLSIVRDHVELTSNGSSLESAIQGVRFHLDEKGASLESFAEPIDALEDEIKPRQFILDKPFLLALTESGATQPYFVMWVANPEVMIPFTPN